MTGPPPARTASTTSCHRRRGRHDVVAVDRDVVDAVAGGPPLERRRVLGRRRRELGVAVVLAEEDDRQLPHGGEVHRLVERALGHRAVAEERHRDAAVGPQLRGRRRARPRSAGRRPRSRWRRRCRASGRRCASSRRGRGSCPASLPISSANIPSGSRPLARQWPWPRWVEVMTSAGRERPAGADGRRLLPDRQVHEARAPRRRGTARPPAARTRGSRSIRRCISRRSASVNMEPCIVLVGTRRGRADDRTDRDPRVRSPAAATSRGKRVVITGAGRGLGRLLAHAFSQAGALGGAGRPHRDRPQGGRRRAPRAVPRAAAAT